MEMEWEDKLRKALGNVRAGGLYNKSPDGEFYVDVLRGFAAEGYIDGEEADVAIIEGMRQRTQHILLRVAEGFGDSSYRPGMTARQELRDFVDRGYVDQEDAHLAIIAGGRNRGVWD